MTRCTRQLILNKYLLPARQSSFPSDRTFVWGSVLLSSGVGLSLKVFTPLLLLLHKRFQITLVISSLVFLVSELAVILSLNVFSLLVFGPLLCTVPSRQSAFSALPGVFHFSFYFLLVLAVGRVRYGLFSAVLIKPHS